MKLNTAEDDNKVNECYISRVRRESRISPA